ncbi:unnamed protein product [Paramecium octaurelia]|uniref:Transmembrane protein n=1 Tax=Paramecium octaurelia TaxID=43137 RepID=A0A8S1SKN1_PAROT|nr:unnamed protein product [Paramecium octaurelia]
MDQKDQEEQTFKNFIKNNLLVFFTYNPKVHKSLNYSRIYNSYWCILEVVQIILVNVVFSATKQQLPVIFFTILICITILINCMIRIGNNYQYFQYFTILTIIIVLIEIAPIYFTVQRLLSID